PRQGGGVPIWVSGTVNAAVARRLARFGAGWIPWGRSAGDLASAIPEMRAAVDAAGRDATELRVVGDLPAVRDDDGGVDVKQWVHRAPPLVDLGITDFRAGLPIPREPDARTEYLSDAVAAFRSAVGRT